ncbi:MAG TPA: alpha/beta hydrolase [Bacillota bacterium]|nr:alpha/beta hydrolase [Bacillota bacterium]
MKNLFRRIVGWLLLIMILLSALPYGITIPSAAKFDPKPPFAESTLIDIDGVSLHYRLWQAQGEVQGKVLLVHGMGGSTYSWNKTAGPLAQAGFAVVAVDLPAFGYSDRSPQVDHSQAARSVLLWQLLDEIDVRLQRQGGDWGWSLVGHSMGGGTVAAMAMDRPEDTSSLVLVAGALLDNNPSAARALLLYPPLRRWLAVIAQNFMFNEERIGGFLQSAYGREATPDEIAGYLEPLRQPGTAQALARLVRTAQNEPLERLAAYSKPALALWGEGDTWVPPSQAEQARAHLPQLDLVLIPGAYHVPMETHAEGFNAALLAFLGANNP